MKAIWNKLLRGTAEAEPALVIGTAEGIAHTRRLVRRQNQKLIGAISIGPAPSGWRHPRSLGTVEQLGQVVGEHGIATAYLCLPMVMHELGDELHQRLAALRVQVRSLPTPSDQLEGRVHPWSGPHSAESLLGRTPHPLDEPAIDRVLRNKCVLITGAGGSIGSQLAMIAARYNPASLLLMDRSENSLFEIDRALAEQSDVKRMAMLHDVTDVSRTEELFQLHQPDVVFHAAAHKHVPMMEDHPHQAVWNNFFGTRSVADAAQAAGCERFVMISSDKAVNPSSVMGATKRMAELYIQWLGGQSPTRYSMVRFGNVLGSACSVIPIWNKQLARGGPITVTDRRMTRYFMTIAEAASLVIQSAALDEGQTPLYVLNMGEPVRIVDLAERFIEMHGLKPGRDVEVIFTGARPGEKLHEQLAYGDEDMSETAHAAVRQLHSQTPQHVHVQWMLETFAQLTHAGDPKRIHDALHQAVPEMIGPLHTTTPRRAIRRTA